ncbi:MAG TPA: cation-translocating P-type ATPase [Cyclobacteriaceae bacterium]|nr:cation-translocating P-type ATPase [Cyclobacteriaceae bacterium]HMV07475.1 cation-translocating P-type ATPase [Cyclobacteriaceae bacterium]HMW99170.1 cation-translocating P-type ATPase [Cyclobacteriaceae bacterium]HMX48197.1 cation-translocating P-type ATPase [Cyclobacteriaceae bacterium]HMY95002.1 cation-translocating P-type ATPase [Cyclobacteriaceae bacterium]
MNSQTIITSDGPILNDDLVKGLTEHEVLRLQKEFGFNKIETENHNSFWQILLGQFKSPIVYILLFAAAMSFYFNEWLDGIAILVVIFINAAIGFYMEFQADRSMEALQKLSIVLSKVIRDGKLKEINSEQIVPGDIVYLEAGDIIPADGKIIKLSRLLVNESALTGESVPVEKIITPESTSDTQAQTLFKGTFVTNGNATYQITSIGMKTELGKIATMVQAAKQAATPLEKKLESFTKKLIQITVLLVVVIFVAGWIAGNDFFEMLNTSIALAVAAIPEGLPIVATLGLARGMLKMAKHNVIVKKLSAVETLGGTSVICTDKTGTLTENKMTVASVQPSSDQQKIIEACILCNTASIDQANEVGDPLEIALLRFASQHSSIQEIRNQFPKIDEEPFSSESKRMLTLHKGISRYVTVAKGAVESVLSISSNSVIPTSDWKLNVLEQANKLASEGYKVIAVASSESDSARIANDNLTYLGIIGLIDPPRKNVPEAIRECKSAGIKVVMITGDHPATAKEIGRQLGIDSTQVQLGLDMKSYEQLTELEKTNWINQSIFARVSPAQKLDLIRLYQEKNFIVGMTGDGVNDAPALKKADIGIAMGLRGTQVAQDVADMVIKDDSFASIVTAIKQGRIIFDNIRKFVVFLLSCNLSELFTIAFTAIINLHFQLFPLQILFINLVTDVLPALALGMTPGNRNIMKIAPKNSDEPIITKTLWITIIFYSIIISAAGLGAVTTSHFLFHKEEGWNPELCNNILFFTLIGSQLLHVFNMNSKGSSVFKSEITRNRYVWYSILVCVVILIGCYEITPVRQAISLFPLTIFDWIIIIAFSFASLIINQLAKIFNIIKQ